MGLTLLENIKAYKVYVINRGRKYWDQRSQQIMEGPMFHHIKQDRDKQQEFTNVLSEIIKSHASIEALIDFTAYSLADIKCSLAAITDSVKQYIYISSDSVYEMSEGLSGDIREDQAINLEILTDK